MSSLGFPFNNEMDDFSQPNRSSLVAPHPSPANFPAAGRRPLSAMSPFVVVERETGRLRAVAGGSGGPLIVSATLQTLARLLLSGADASRAVGGARVHDQLLPLPTRTGYESGIWAPVHSLPNATVDALRRRGQVMSAQHFGVGVAQAIAVEYSSGDDGDSSDNGNDGGGRSSGSGSGNDADSGVLVAVSDLRKDGAPFASKRRRRRRR